MCTNETTSIPTRLRSLLAVASVAFMYLWVFPYHPRVNNPNENVRVYMTVALVDDHTFAINRIERDWGYTNDKAVREGRLYSSKAPGASYLGAPAYWLLTKLTHRSSLNLTAQQIAAHHAPPIDRALVVYILRLFTTILPSLVFAWFWHRFLGSYTRLAALRECVFYSTMLGSQLFAYSEVFTSHSLNAISLMGAIMALATLRRRDQRPGEGSWSLGLMSLAGLLGASATMFEYPAAIGSVGVALLILATAVEKRPALIMAAIPMAAVAALCVVKHRLPLAALLALGSIAYFAATLSVRSLSRLTAAALGSLAPIALTMLFHKKCFGSPFTPGYSFLENPDFHATTSQGFYGATAFSWEAGLRLWLDPAFGMIPCTVLFVAALPGAGAWLGLRPPRPVGLGLGTVFVAVAVATLTRVVPPFVKLTTDGWTGPALTHVSVMGYVVLALMAAAAVLLPKPTGADPALGATMVLITYGLSRLIGMMNNWRGGWTVGPRYLATLVPIAGLLALGGLDALARGGAVQRRLCTVFAAGATVHAMAVSGLPSAYFPHVPESFGSPLFELFLPLIRGGMAPHNVGRYLLHWEGARGMAPFFLVALLISLWLLRGEEKRPLSALAHGLLGAALALTLTVPMAASARPASEEPMRYVRSVFEPETPMLRAVARSANESPAQARQRAMELLQSGNGNGALEVYRRAMPRP